MQLINDIIDISKIESNQLEVNKKSCNLSEILVHTETEFRQHPIFIEKDKLEISHFIDKKLKDLSINTDPVRFKQVLDNLVSNAIKYSDSGMIEIRARVNQEEVVLSVKDDGPGIAPEDQASVFERFNRVDDDFSVDGSGLGLSISKGIVELLGGRIWLESETGKGSVFSFSIPLEIPPGDGEKNALSTGDASSPIMEGMTIYIAEDDLPSLLFLKEILSSTNADIRHFENGIELLNAMHEKMPDLILLDISMPVLNGFKVLDIIRDEGMDVPVIAQTAYAMPEEREKCMEKGCTAYISKPISETALFIAIRNSLSGKTL